MSNSLKYFAKFYYVILLYSNVMSVTEPGLVYYVCHWRYFNHTIV